MATQDIEPLDSVRVNIPQCSLEEAMQKIASISGYRFAYRQKLIESKQQTSLHFSGTFQLLMETVFEAQDLCFTIRAKQVIIHTKCRPTHINISGFIIDSVTHSAVPYASINLINTSFGIIADHEGYYELKIPYSESTDTLVISCMGYQRDTIFVHPQNREELATLLAPKVYTLPEAIVRPHAFEMVQLGNKKDKSIGSIYLDTHGQQAALFIENKKGQSGTIESIEYFLSKKGNTRAPFRVRIYDVDSTGLPGDDLVEDVIVVKPEKSDGWYRIDIEKEGIPFPQGGVFIAIEGVFPDDYDYYMGNEGFVDLKESRKQRDNKSLLSYGQRLGYNRKGRKNTWHYSMDKVWFQIEKQPFGVMISANVKIEKKTDSYDQE